MIDAGDPWRWLPVLLAPFVGSFLGTIIVRLPQGETMVLARSRCPHCRRTLAPADLVPLVSWIVRGGRCRTCNARLGLFYPGVEIAATAAALWAVLTVDAGAVWVSCGLGWTLLAIGWIDARHLWIPDRLSLALAAAGLLWAASGDDGRFGAHAIGVAAGLLAFSAVAVAYRRLRGRDGLGFGDAKLLAAGGAWVAWPGLPGIVLIAAVTALAGALAGALLAGRDGQRLRATTRLPFGPFLCLGIWLVWLYGPLLPA
jgi:leader peptidase (prepilin peptidase)/N-methyltransferase